MAKTRFHFAKITVSILPRVYVHVVSEHNLLEATRARFKHFHSENLEIFNGQNAWNCLCPFSLQTMLQSISVA